jgi:hypothetical protein
MRSKIVSKFSCFVIFTSTIVHPSFSRMVDSKRIYYIYRTFCDYISLAIVDMRFVCSLTFFQMLFGHCRLFEKIQPFSIYRKYYLICCRFLFEVRNKLIATLIFCKVIKFGFNISFLPNDFIFIG